MVVLNSLVVPACRKVNWHTLKSDLAGLYIIENDHGILDSKINEVQEPAIYFWSAAFKIGRISKNNFIAI